MVEWGLIKILTKRFDLFAELKARGGRTLEAESGGGAPVKPGPVVLTYQGRLPAEIPRAKFDTDLRACTGEEDDLTGLKLKADFLPGSPG